MAETKKTRKVRWMYEEVIGDRKFYARMARGEIAVRVERVGNFEEYAEWGYPKIMGLGSAVAQAAIETKDSDIRP